MGDIGIGIKVGYTEVIAGKKALDGLKQSLEEVKDNSDFSFGADGNAMEGATKGAKQFRKELEGASSATAKITKDYNALIKTTASMASKNLGPSKIGAEIPGYKPSSQAEMDRNTAKSKREADAYWKETDKPGIKNTKQVHREFAPDKDGGDGGRSTAETMMNKMGMAIAGAVTVGSIMAFLQRARTKYIEGAINESGLEMRGITGTGPYMGNTRTEMQQFRKQLHSQSGYTGDGSIHSAIGFSAATGTDPSLGIGVMASSRDLTGGGAKTGEKMLGVLQAISKATHDSPERINRLLSGSYGLFSKAQGGAELAGTQLANIQALTEALHKTGTQGRDPGTMGVMKGAFKSTGDAATDILKNKMMGLYDGPMSFDKVWQIKKREEEGLTNKDNRAEFLKMMKDPTMQRSQKMMLASHFFQGMDTGGVETFVDKTIGKLDEGGLENLVEKYSNVKGVDTSKYRVPKAKQRLAEKEEMQHGAGLDVENAADPWERRAYGAVNKIFESGAPKSIADLMEYLDKKVGGYDRNKPTILPESVDTPVLMLLTRLFSGDTSPIISTIKDLIAAINGAGGDAIKAKAGKTSGG